MAGEAREPAADPASDPALPAVASGGRAAPDRARPWLMGAWIAAACAILAGALLVAMAVTSARVLQPTGTIDQAVMVQVTSFSIAPSLIELGMVAVVALLAVSAVRRAGTAPHTGPGARAVGGVLRSPPVVALAILAAVGVAITTWTAGWEPEPAGSVSYFGQPTYDDLWPVRLEYLASAVGGAATIAAVGGCVGILVAIGVRLRSR